MPSNSAEIRIDPISGERSVLAPNRSDRPGALFTVDPQAQPVHAKDPFAEGNEAQTPPELYAVRESGSANTAGWKVRVVPNLFPTVTPDAPQTAPPYPLEFFSAIPASGNHEVIVNGPQLVSCLADLPTEQLKTAMQVWRTRMQHYNDAAFKHLIINEGRLAGASLPHTHSQLYALNFVPATVARERERFNAYANDQQGSNLLADLVQNEVRLKDRLIDVDDEAVLLAPYASRVPYQMMLIPRKATAKFEADGPLGAELLHSALNRLKRKFGTSPPLNAWVRTAPQGADHFCWRVDILPRLTVNAGLELGAGINVNIVTPEQAASELRSV